GIYTLSLHDALPIWAVLAGIRRRLRPASVPSAVHSAVAVPGRVADPEGRVLPRLETDPGAGDRPGGVHRGRHGLVHRVAGAGDRSEEHTSELQSREK